MVDMTPRPQSEAALHGAVMAFLRVALPSDAVVHHSPNESDGSAIYTKKQMGKGMVPGWPDLEIIYEGRIYFIELKSAKGRITANQNLCMGRLERAGAPVALCRTLEGVEAFLAKHMPLRASLGARRVA